MKAIEKKGHLNSALSIHPYFGKVDPALVEALILKFSKKNELVLDPFCGSGTVLHECVLNERKCAGWDSSALAVLIATCKLAGLKEDEEKELLSIRQYFSEYLKNAKNGAMLVPDKGNLPSMPRILNIDKWFNSNALHELKYIKWWLEKMTNNYPVPTFLLARLAFSRIITKASNQQSESNYRSIDKPDIPGRVIKLFLNSLDEVIISCKAFNSERLKTKLDQSRILEWHNNNSNISYVNEVNVSIEHFDSRNFAHNTMSGNGANLVVTSPPYLMSWDYGLYHKFRFYWLGFDLDSYEETEIGRHLRRKNDDIERYTNDMNAVFKKLYHVVDSNGTICMINSPSSVNGEMVNTNEILCQCATSQGWVSSEVIPSISISGPHHGMYASSKIRGASVSGNAGKREHILVFKKN